MALVKVTRNFQISIPKEIRAALQLEEGDYVELEERDGQIVLIPKKVIDADQAWFWSPEWQRGEREADQDIRKGRLSPPMRNARDLKKHLGA